MSGIIKNINKSKLSISTLKKQSHDREYLIDKESYRAEKPTKNMAVTVSDIRNQSVVSCVDAFNNRLLESFGVFFSETT